MNSGLAGSARPWAACRLQTRVFWRPWPYFCERLEGSCPSSKASHAIGTGPFRCAVPQYNRALAAKSAVGMSDFLGTIGLVSARHPAAKDLWPDQLDPGPAEWAVLDILWSQGPCSVSFVEQALASSGRWSGAAAPALLARLIESGLARYEDRRRRPMHVQAAVAKTALQEELCRRFAKRHFSGDLKRLERSVLHAQALHSGSSSSEMSQSSKAQG